MTTLPIRMMPRIIEVEQPVRYGRLTLIERAPVESKDAYWMCLCDCGNVKTIALRHVKAGKTQSCGCLQKEVRGLPQRRHGLSKTRTHNIWVSMKARATNPNHPRAADYVGRGITCCDRWLRFDNFLEDMGVCPSGLTLERIDNDKGYYAENCRWATYAEQARNRRKPRIRD